MQTARGQGGRPAAPQGASAAETQPRQFVNFLYCKLDAAFRRLPKDERDRGIAEWLAVYHEFRDRVMIYPYTLFGIRAEVDFMLWRISYRIEDFTEMSAALARTGFGAYVNTAHSSLSMTKRSVYVDEHVHDDQEGARSTISVANRKYLVVYPFEKTREWYRLTSHARQGMMNEHIEVGHKYPQIKLNTTYSFGLDDQEFVVAFETDHLEQFVDLVMELRESEASRYTKRDTPIYTCIAGDVEAVIDSLGG
ncbi:chlorite dismutase family protein [Candidatus Poribacteria bacterium]|jgi:chlorite dismutase|nr:chlorite dismutase family protein [Candidatus Poribacteria bacterium]MBT5531513.1 chlorite dismutase family protein [Candidatus Poribacteria bacterium]MBT7101136.1 chlorite dismutase family protein [Candidatus Poribacteria bacterium]MBT7807926.1 chlorite dismutase family protein [Candidatus Poribacteria bacterium]